MDAKDCASNWLAEPSNKTAHAQLKKVSRSGFLTIIFLLLYSGLGKACEGGARVPLVFFELVLWTYLDPSSGAHRTQQPSVHHER